MAPAPPIITVTSPEGAQVPYEVFFVPSSWDAAAAPAPAPDPPAVTTATTEIGLPIAPATSSADIDKMTIDELIAAANAQTAAIVAENQQAWEDGFYQDLPTACDDYKKKRTSGTFVPYTCRFCAKVFKTGVTLKEHIQGRNQAGCRCPTANDIIKNASEKKPPRFRSTPQPNLLNRVIGQPRGKQLGGSAGINLMVMMYPSRENIDAWSRLGNKGWSWDTLEPYFRKMATVTPPGENARTVAGVDWYDPALGGGDGPLQVTWGEGYAENLQGAWVRAFDSLGLKMTGDPRSGSAIGGFQNMQAIHPRTKTRSYPPTAWYNAAVRARENLVVMTGTLVKKIVTRHDVATDSVLATGVVIQTAGGEEQLMYARREVILAAGVFQSPQILELSGIGGRALLESHKIPVVIENDAVGENLQDHAIVAQLFEIKDGVYSLDRLRDPDFRNQALLLFATNGTGPLAQAQLASAYTPFMDLKGRMSAEDVTAMLDAHVEKGENKEYDVLREDMERANRNQVQYHLFPATLTAPDAAGNVPAFTTPHIAAMALLSHPFSRGSVHIVSDSVVDKPQWDPAFLSHPLDIEILARSVQFTEKIVSAAPFADSLTGKRFPNVVGDTLEKAKDIVREVTISSFHPSGSLAMKPKADGGVVDERLKVYGTANVRVVDASVFPLEPSGNILATVYAVAERAADIIKEDARK